MILYVKPDATLVTGKPRASGDDPTWQDYMLVAGKVNPARAGMIPPWRPSRTSCRRKPRASGDDPDFADAHSESKR